MHRARTFHAGFRIVIRPQGPCYKCRIFQRQTISAHLHPKSTKQIESACRFFPGSLKISVNERQENIPFSLSCVPFLPTLLSTVCVYLWRRDDFGCMRQWFGFVAETLVHVLLSFPSFLPHSLAEARSKKENMNHPNMMNTKET